MMIKNCHLMPLGLMQRMDLGLLNDFFFVETAWCYNQDYGKFIKDWTPCQGITNATQLRTKDRNDQCFVVDNSVHLLRRPVDFIEGITVARSLRRDRYDVTLILPDVKNDMKETRKQSIEALKEWDWIFKKENIRPMIVLQGISVEERIGCLLEFMEVISKDDQLFRYTLGIPYIGFNDKDYSSWRQNRVDTFHAVTNEIARSPLQIRIHLLGLGDPAELTEEIYHASPYDVYNDTSAAYGYTQKGQEITSWLDMQTLGKPQSIGADIDLTVNFFEFDQSLFVKNLATLNRYASGK